MKRSDFFRGVWLSPLALVRGPEPTPTSLSTVDAQQDPAFAATPAMLNVRAFGAVGDGSADDTEALESAINSSGGAAPVYFPPGTYRVTRQLALTVTAYSLVGARTERTGGLSQATTIQYRPSSSRAPMIRVVTTDGPTLDQGPFEHIDLRFDCNDGVNDPDLFQFGDEGTGILSQRNTFGARWERCYFNGNIDPRESTPAGVLTRSGQYMVRLTAAFEAVFEDCRFIGGDVQVRFYACDKPSLTRCRSLYSNLPFEFEGASDFQVQQSMVDVQIEGWALVPISVKECGVGAVNLRLEQNDAALRGIGWFTLASVTVSVTANSGALTFSAPMDNILFPGISIIRLTDGNEEFVALVRTVSGTSVTVHTDTNVLLWSAEEATVQRLHGTGPLVHSSFDTAWTNISIAPPRNSPAFVYVVAEGHMAITNAVEPYGAGIANGTSLVIGNKFPGNNNLNSLMSFSGCQPLLVADPSSPFVHVSNVRPDYGGRAAPITGRSAWQGDKRSRIGDLFYEKSLTRRVWAWSPKSYSEDSPGAAYAIPLVNVAGEPDTDEFLWCWNMRTSIFVEQLRLTDESLPSESGALRVAFKVKGSDAGSVLRWRMIGDGNGSTHSVTLTGDWQVVEAFLQTIPPEWASGRERSTQTGIEVLTASTTDFYLAAVVVEELPLFQTAKIVTLTDAATITIDAALGGKYTVTLTGNRTMGTPTNPAIGQEIEFDIVQDNRGGRRLSWSAVFRQAWSDAGNTRNRRSTIRFYYDGTNWIQMGGQSPYV